jgi:hypothetical protein
VISLYGERHPEQEKTCYETQHGHDAKVEAGMNHAEHQCLAYDGTEPAGEVLEFCP